MDADDKQVFVTVVVVIADSDAHSVASPGKAGLDGHVAECAIAIILDRAGSKTPGRSW